MALGNPIDTLQGVDPSFDTPEAIKFIPYVDSNGVADGTGGFAVRLYNGGSALTNKATYMVDFDGDEETNPKITACVATTVDVTVVVAASAVAASSWGWFFFKGYCDVLVEGTTDVAKDDYLKLLTGTTATALLKDGTSRTTDSIAIACAAQASNSEVSTKVYLFGDKVDIDAS